MPKGAAMFKLFATALFCTIAGSAITYVFGGQMDENRILELQLKAARESRVEFAREALATAEAAVEARVLGFYSLQQTARSLVEAEVDSANTSRDEVAAWRKYSETLQ